MGGRAKRKIFLMTVKNNEENLLEEKNISAELSYSYFERPASLLFARMFVKVTLESGVDNAVAWEGCLLLVKIQFF